MLRWTRLLVPFLGLRIIVRLEYGEETLVLGIMNAVYTGITPKSEGLFESIREASLGYVVATGEITSTSLRTLHMLARPHLPVC
jgi:hypothetical protein